MSKPEQFQNAEVLKQEFDSTQAAIRALIGEGSARDYFDQSKLYPNNPNLYLILNPNPITPNTLSRDEILSLSEKIGPDFYRLRAINPRLLGSSYLLPLGGSCAIETWGMRLINGLGKKHIQPRSELANFLLSLAPTITHITGAILPAGDLGVHFIEDGLWGQRIEDDYGVEQGRLKTTQAYQKIHEAVERRSKLATGNPDYQLIAINFDELSLLNGPLQRWFEEMEIDFDPNFRIAQVIYTYVGPELLDLVKNALRVRGIRAQIDRFDLACRLKQIDHNDWDATMAELKPVILGSTPNQRQLSLLSQYPFMAGLRISQWIRDNYQTNLSQPSGFFDLSYDGKVSHMSGLYKPTNDPEEVRRLISTIQSDPRILREGNLEQHLEYLRGYLEPDRFTPQPPHSTKQQIKELQKSRQQIESKIKNIKDTMAILDLSIQLITSPIETSKKEQFKGAVSYLINRYRKFVDSLLRRYSLKDISQISSTSLSEMDKRDIRMWRELISYLRQIGFQSVAEGEILNISLNDNEPTINWRDCFIDMFESEKETTQNNLELKQNNLCAIERQITSLQTPVEFSYPTPSTFPLSRNLIVMYATQFVFDPDFRNFLIYVSQVNKSDKPSEEKSKDITEACRMIFPKLERYLKYIFEGGDYPSDLRYSRVFSLQQ